MPSRNQALLARALQHQQAGETTQAEALFRRIVRDDPYHAEAWNLFGIFSYQSGQAEDALSCFDRARQVAPTNPDYRSNRGAILQGLGRHAEAVAEFREALRLNPRQAETHYNVAKALSELGRHEEAETFCRRALELKPVFPEAYHNLGNILRALERLPEAEASYRRALELRPNLADVHNNLGIVLRDLLRHEEAAARYRRALELQPAYPEAYSNLGDVLRDLGRFAESEAACRRALELKPDHAEAHNNLANVLRDLGRTAECEPCFRRALDFRPDSADFHHNLAGLMLLTGDYQRGWTEYEWRLQLPGFGREFARPRWQGEPLAGRTILIHCEQGLGDTLQFVRFAPLVKQLGATVLLECPPELIRLLRTAAGIDDIMAHGSPLPHFDVQVPLMSLPGLLRTKVATIPAAVPYLTADAEATERWRQELAGYSGFKIGIVWQGNPRFAQPQCRAADQRRSPSLARFEPIAGLPGVRLFSLQKGYGTEQLAQWQSRWNIVDLGERFGDFMETAALMSNLDLVISPDTSPVHLAGALGVPVWTVLPVRGCWRWLLDREDSPWYPTMRLFRQPRPGEWGPVFEQLARELAARKAPAPTR